MSAATTEAAPKLNPKLIVPFVNSVREVFATMAKVETTVQRPHLKSAAEAEAQYDVSGIIGFSGEVVGSVILSFERSAAVKLVEAFAGMAIDPASPDFADAVGELANMVAGSAKKNLGVKSSITVPNVIIGKGHTIARLSGVANLVIPCTSACGNFAVEVSIKQVTEEK
jgi:chemotaxis protein CheX